MSSTVKLFLLFFAGFILSVLIKNSLFTPTVLPIQSRLPELIFPKTSSPLTIAFTGDVMLGRSVNTRMIKYHDFTWPFKNVAPLLSGPDMTIINLEAPFMTGCRPADTGMIFCADPQSVAGLKLAGIDVATIANNHINNQGQKGIDETVKILKNNGITPVVSGNSELIQVKNTKLAIISFSDLSPLLDKQVVAPIAAATGSADLVIVTFHWGKEYQKNPTSRQVYLAHLSIDSGADIVVGHHPHWIQTEEIYQGKPIYYSLGNLVFDQMWSEETRLGQILFVTYEDKKLIKKELLPIKIFDYGQPALN